MTRIFLFLLPFTALCPSSVHAEKTLKVFVLAGDESMLRQGSIDGVARGPGVKPVDPADAAMTPGTLLDILGKEQRFEFMRGADGKWTARNDVAVYDAHPLSNNTRKVHDAQMAVCKDIPNVAAIDTIPFYFPKENSPGGREWDYRNNAASYLLIGESMGSEMVGLLDRK